MKKKTVTGILAVILGACTLLSCLCSCDAPAPAGMYAPVDAEEYVEGVEDVIFSVPEEYRAQTLELLVLNQNGEQIDFRRYVDAAFITLEYTSEQMENITFELYFENTQIDKKVLTTAMNAPTPTPPAEEAADAWQ